MIYAIPQLVAAGRIEPISRHYHILEYGFIVRLLEHIDDSLLVQVECGIEAAFH